MTTTPDHQDDLAAVRRSLAGADPAATLDADTLAAGRAEARRQLDSPTLLRQLTVQTALRSPRPSRARRWAAPLAAAALAASAVGVAGVAGVALTRADSPTVELAHGPGAQVVLASYSATKEAGTARAELVVTVDGETVRAEGVGNFDSGDAVGAARLPDPIGEVQVISLDGVLYVSVPGVASEAAEGKQWVKLDTRSAGLGAAVANSFGAAKLFDPAQALDYLTAVSGEVTEVGPDTVRGVATTRYRAAVDLDRLADKAPPAFEELREAGGETHETLPAELWVDAEGRLRRLTVTYTEQAGQPGPTAEATFELWDFGAEVTAEAPPANQVIDLLTAAANAAKGD